jgi:DNA-binding CsgD family transcriptional regulator
MERKMPQKTATKIEISERERQILEEYSRSTHQPLHLKIRSEIILQAARGLSNNAIERNMKLSPRRIKTWRDRYSDSREKIAKIEEETPNKLRSAIKEALSDEQRAGAPATFRDEQVAAIVALACEDPAMLELPFSHWSAESLREEAIKLGIVQNISARQVSRFLKRREFEAAPGSILAESKNRRL